MNNDSDDYASLGNKFRRWIGREAERERHQTWLLGVAAGAICLVLLYFFIHFFARKFP